MLELLKEREMKVLRQRISYLLKHNLALQNTYRAIFNALFKFLGIFIKIDPQLIIFVSLMGSRYNDSPRSIYEYIKSHDEYKKYRCIWGFEDPSKYPDIPSVRIDTPKYFFLLLKAGYWVSNTNIQRGLSFKKKKTKWMNTCHGTAIKLCGNDCPGRKDFDYSDIDYITVQSKYDEMVSKRGFKSRDESFVEIGRACSDQLFHATQDDYLTIRKKLGLPSNKKVILYAPTWRDSVDGGASYEIKPPIDLKKWEKCLGDQYVVLFRAHHITTKVLNVVFNDFVRDYSDYPEINDLLIASDILISDYSAVLTDFAILNKPIICFAYDYDNYLKERGTYFELDEVLPNKSCRTESEVIEQIRNLDYKVEAKKTEAFRKKFIEFGGNATPQAVKILLGK